MKLAKMELATFLFLWQSSKTPSKNPMVPISVAGTKSITRTLSTSNAFLTSVMAVSLSKPYDPNFIKDIIVSAVVHIKVASSVGISWSIGSLVGVKGSMPKSFELCSYCARISSKESCQKKWDVR